MTIKRMIMEGRVSRGVRFLDRTLTREGWLPNVDGESLDLANGNTCMIGQLFPSTMRTFETNFKKMIKSGRLGTFQAIRCGFLLSELSPIGPTRQNYEMLTDVWIDRMALLKKEVRGKAAAEEALAKGSQVSPIQAADVETVGIKRKA